MEGAGAGLAKKAGILEPKKGAVLGSKGRLGRRRYQEAQQAIGVAQQAMLECVANP